MARGIPRAPAADGGDAVARQHRLAVALEFTLAADILRTAIAPSWEDIGKLAAIAMLRTLLNHFLQREIETAARHEEGARSTGAEHRPAAAAAAARQG